MGCCKALVHLCEGVPHALIKNHDVNFIFDSKSILIILMLGLIHTGVAYCLYFSGMANLPVQTIAVLGYLEPVVSVICSALFLHERMDIYGWIGAILIYMAAFFSEYKD